VRLLINLELRNAGKKHHALPAPLLLRLLALGPWPLQTGLTQRGEDGKGEFIMLEEAGLREFHFFPLLSAQAKQCPPILEWMKRSLYWLPEKLWRKFSV
jgi:hypothetical protein